MNLSKEEILSKIKEVKPEGNYNVMGCCEDWYNPYYAIGKTFGDEELNLMSELELNNLLLLASTISDFLY